jgi:hypothetical protein
MFYFCTASKEDEKNKILSINTIKKDVKEQIAEVVG